MILWLREEIGYLSRPRQYKHKDPTFRLKGPRPAESKNHGLQDPSVHVVFRAQAPRKVREASLRSFIVAPLIFQMKIPTGRGKKKQPTQNQRQLQEGNLQVLSLLHNSRTTHKRSR